MTTKELRLDTEIEKQPLTGRKLRLNLGGLSGEAARAMSQGTLENGGWRPMEPGNRMADGSVYAGVSPEKGRPMYLTRFDQPLRMTFNDAVACAASLDAHGHKDWCIATKDEMLVIGKNREAIGDFNTVETDAYSLYYWSSTPLDTFSVFAHDMTRNSTYASNSKSMLQRLRCVRYG